MQGNRTSSRFTITQELLDDVAERVAYENARDFRAAIMDAGSRGARLPDNIKELEHAVRLGEIGLIEAMWNLIDEGPNKPSLGEFSEEMTYQVFKNEAKRHGIRFPSRSDCGARRTH